MGIKSLFSHLFGHSDDEMPSSLGHHTKAEPSATNLGPNIKPSDEPEKKSNSEVENVKNPSDEKKESQKEESTPASSTYNLIILDESGSMYAVRDQTISGCNETLNSIRNIAKEQPEIKQYVSIFCFSSTNSRYIFQDMPVENTRDLTPDDYRPNSCTPLYDAIGYTVTLLRNLIEQTEAVGVVTIITDGYENASRRWNHPAVVELIEGLKKQGWVFTFIGANIDVERTAKGMGIDSFVKFEQTDQGMYDMFEKERLSRRAYSEKRRYMQHMDVFSDMSTADREEALGAMNDNYFVDKERVAPDFIKSLNPNEVLVFGSNVSGQHNGGAAMYALNHFGAIEGQAEGIQGHCYAIPTHGNTFGGLKKAIARFTDYVVMHPRKRFMLTAVGCGEAGYSVEQIAPLFRQAYSFGNVYVPKAFLPYMSKEFTV